MIEDTLDAVLQQQLISPSFRIYDRLTRKTLLVPGTKAVYKMIRAGVLEGFRATMGKSMGAFVEFLVQKFRVPKKAFDERLSGLPANDNTVDARLKFIMVVSALREHWQNLAYEEVLSELRALLMRRGIAEADVTRDKLNSVLSLHFGQDFSHLVNLYVVRLWGKVAGIPVKIRPARLSIVNRLVANLVKILKK